jgi:hypothetical protein
MKNFMLAAAILVTLGFCTPAYAANPMPPSQQDIISEVEKRLAAFLAAIQEVEKAQAAYVLAGKIMAESPVWDPALAADVVRAVNALASAWAELAYETRRLYDITLGLTSRES